MSLPQIVGLDCALCRGSIASIVEGTFCALCGNPIHRKCIQSLVSRGIGGYFICGDDPAKAPPTWHWYNYRPNCCFQCGGDKSNSIAVDVRRNRESPPPATTGVVILESIRGALIGRLLFLIVGLFILLLSLLPQAFIVPVLVAFFVIVGVGYKFVGGRFHNAQKRGVRASPQSEELQKAVASDDWLMIVDPKLNLDAYWLGQDRKKHPPIDYQAAIDAHRDRPFVQRHYAGIKSFTAAESIITGGPLEIANSAGAECALSQVPVGLGFLAHNDHDDGALIWWRRANFAWNHSDPDRAGLWIVGPWLSTYDSRSEMMPLISDWCNQHVVGKFLCYFLADALTALEAAKPGAQPEKQL